MVSDQTPTALSEPCTSINGLGTKPLGGTGNLERAPQKVHKLCIFPESVCLEPFEEQIQTFPPKHLLTHSVLFEVRTECCNTATLRQRCTLAPASTV